MEGFSLAGAEVVRSELAAVLAAAAQHLERGQVEALAGILAAPDGYDLIRDIVCGIFTLDEPTLRALRARLAAAPHLRVV